MRILVLDNCIYTQREMRYMSKTYLFSPIGNTDPIKYFYDGSMLHICRYYKPDVVILYLSHEMILHHEKDNRYVRSIELLGEKLGHTFEVRIIRDEQMVDVQQYDLFYHAFRGIIADIEEEMMPEDTLIVNMASGTPAMKSALLVMATLAEYRFCRFRYRHRSGAAIWNMKNVKIMMWRQTGNWMRTISRRQRSVARKYDACTLFSC